ncbi:MAG: LysE family translocator [Cohaesibacteraceae bacterium]|nr:LysE family translocator [Cohaesibacteraceae bacterium]
MSLDLYLSFIVFSIIIIIVPGPNVTLILATSALQGVRQGIISMAGTSLAQVVQVTMVAFGLVWLVESFGTVFEIIRWMGAAYLVYLGIQTWRSAKQPVAKTVDPKSSFRKGFLVGLSNPKSLTFIAAFFPQFIDASLPVEPQFAILAVSYLTLAVLLDGSYAIVGAYGGRLLATAKARLILGRSCGMILMGGGAWLATASKS